MRELEEWVPEEGEGDMMMMGEGGPDMELGSDENGWSAQDMFKQNKALYNVESTYKASLEGYTTQLSKENTDEYR